MTSSTVAPTATFRSTHKQTEKDLKIT